MYAVQPYLFEIVSSHSRAFQDEVERLAERFSLKIDGGFPTLEIQVSPYFQAQLEYTLWGESGVVSIKGRLQFEDSEPGRCESFPVVMRFSLSHDPLDSLEDIKQRVEACFHRDVNVHWNLPPAGHLGHVELSLHFVYRPQSNELHEYAQDVLGMITGRVRAA